jgi:hypothetical protein
MSVLPVSRICLLSGLGSLALALTGCALNGGSDAILPAAGNGMSSGSGIPRTTLGGKVYGGQQPINGAAVTLWAAGTSASYGTGATSIAFTTTDSNGNFSFNVGNASPCTPGQYLYITSLGGNPGAGFNTYAAVMAALPTPCGPATAGTFVIVNEVTTVASVTALQQFMTITPGGTPAWMIGAPSANVIGLANAFLQVGNLVSISAGASAPTTATNTINSVTYTTTITPDSTKINALADILAACINTNGSGTCGSLFADATPATSTAPTDTIEAMYYLATNAGGVSLPAHSTAQGEPYYLCSTYITGTPPFQPYGDCSSTSTTYPTDWAIGVSWNASNGTATVGTATPYSLAIDGPGNIWTAYSCGASSTSCTDTLNDTHNGPAYVTEFNPQGQVQFAPVSSTTLTAGPGLTAGITGSTYSLRAGAPFSLAIDTANNAWFDSYWGANPLTPANLGGVVTEIAPSGASNGYVIAASAPGAMAIDGGNNIWLDDAPSYNTGNRYYLSELEYKSGAYSTLDEGLGRQTVIFSGVWVDSLGYGWSAASTAAKCGSPTGTIYRATTAEMETASATDDVGSVTVCPVWSGAADPNGGAFYANGGLYHVAVTGTSGARTAVMVSEAAGTGTTNGGLDGGAGAVVDGLNNIWVANGTGGVSEFSYTGTAFTPLSPAGTATVPVYGFGSSYLSGTHPINVATDASGNVWIGTQTLNLWYLVGIAGPTVTPTSQMLKTSFIGSRPGALTLASLSPALTYNSVASVGQPQTAMLTNTGSANVNISGITIGGTNPSDFSVSSTTCGSTLAIGANCTITVTFNSATAGTFLGTLNVASNAAGSPASVNLTGTASASAGTINLQPGTVPPAGPAIAFGTVVASSVTTAQAVVLTNTGSTAMTLALGMTGTGANLFPETTNCGSSLAAGASCFVSLKFAPKVAGSYSAVLTVTNDAGTGPQGTSLSGTATPFTITVNSSNPIAWVIDNGAITFNWNAVTGNLNSWVLDGYSDQLVDTTTLGNFTYNGTSMSQPEGLYSGMVGPFMNGTPTASCTMVGATIVGTPTTTCTAGSGTTPYVDWAITWPDTASASNAYTFVWHNVVFPNDPGVHTYVQLVHNASDIAGGVGQIQWIFRDNQSTFTNTYEVNSGLNWLGVEDIPLPPWNDPLLSDAGRNVQNAATDLHGDPNVSASYGRWFETKYDYAGYEYLHQAHGLYGPASSGTTYGVWTVLPKLETLVGGPTKQDLYFTGNIDMIEAQSNHELNELNMSTAAGVASNRLFGPYYIHVNTLGQAYNQTGTTLASQADMYADAISAEAGLVSQYDNVDPLVAAGYVASTGRGAVSIQVNGVAGAAHTAWAVLSDPNTNFQYSNQGMQYWADISQNGTATISGVAPGTYRLSVYVLGQWGEYRQDGIVVTANNTTPVSAVTFQPENFTNVNGAASGETVFTIGTPDRSSHEFLHGHNTTTGNDDREYWGNWNYWQDFAANQGAVVYYATAVGSTPATNDLSKWNYVHWGTFNPGLFGGVFSSSDDTADGYSQYPGQTYAGINGVGGETAIPTYVAGLSGASGTNGAATGIPAWQVYFATPNDIASYASGNVELSISSACTYGSYVVTLNPQSANVQRIWHYANYSDCMIRSGLSGYTQWFVMEFPASALNQTPGGSNEITVTMSQTDGSQDDAWRLELTNNTSNPAVTGWNDYTYVIGTGFPGTGTANSSGLYNNDAVPNP